MGGKIGASGEKGWKLAVGPAMAVACELATPCPTATAIAWAYAAAAAASTWLLVCCMLLRALLGAAGMGLEAAQLNDSNTVRLRGAVMQGVST